MGLPIGGEAGASVVVYGLVGAGRRPVRDPWPREDCLSRPATRTTTLRSAAAARGTTGENVLVGGTGTKILAVVEVAVMNFKVRWTEAVLRRPAGA